MPLTTAKTATTANDIIFLSLTCNRFLIEEHRYHEEQHHELPSTHDAAELMLYAFLDSAPYVADLLWSKQQLKQGEFLTLTAEQEWSLSDGDIDATTSIPSTHEPRL